MRILGARVQEYPCQYPVPYVLAFRRPLEDVYRT